MLWYWIVACTPETPDTPVARVTCSPQPDNTLRVDCAVDLRTESGTVLTYTDPDGVSVTLTAAPALHTVYTLWGLRADTAYDVEVDDGAGPLTTTFTTGALPSAFAELTVETSGVSSLDAVVQELTCGGEAYVVVLDTRGEVRWYQEAGLPAPPGAPAGGGGIFGLSLTDVPSVLVSNMESIREWTFTGAPGMSIDGGPGEYLHHDVARSGEDTVALFAEGIEGPDGADYLIDGVAVFDAAGDLVDEWHLADHIDPSWLTAGGGPPSGPQGPADGPLDWSHGNAITVAEDVGWIVSFRWLSAVFAVDGSRESPTFGEVLGVIAGNPASPVPSSFVIDAEGEFIGQHHATLVGEQVTLFDNRAAPDDSRTVTLQLDLKGGTATTVETHSMGETCDVEGAAFPLPDGGVFATCATSATGREFPAGSGDDPTFTIHASCAGPGGADFEPVGRIVPFSLP